MESDLQQQHHHHHHQHLFHGHHQQQPPAPANPGLTRFRSAPSSFFASLLDRDFCEDFLNRPSSPETERILSRLISGSMEDPVPPPPPMPAPQNLGSFRQNSPPQSEPAAHRPPLAVSVKSETEVLQQSNFSSAPYYHQSSPQPPPLPNRSTNYASPKIGRGNNSSNLIRQSSSPAGLFSNINIDSGFAAMRGNLGPGNLERALPLAPRFGNNPDSLTRVSSFMAQMVPIAEVRDKTIGESIQEADPFGESNNFITGFPAGSWDDSDNYSPLKRGRDDDEKNFPGLNASDAMNEDVRGGLRPPQILAHHLSLPNTPTEMSAIEKLLQESVPCKIRAKRGCATHPRSIAERVRRTKISERMRKLQHLVPDMDKQTNTADMLDLAVEHIKDLQQQVKMLSANRAACTCASRHQL